MGSEFDSTASYIDSDSVLFDSDSNASTTHSHCSQRKKTFQDSFTSLFKSPFAKNKKVKRASKQRQRAVEAVVRNASSSPAWAYDGMQKFISSQSCKNRFGHDI